MIFFIALLLILVFEIVSGEYKSIQEFEKAKATTEFEEYKFQYFPKENEETGFSELLLNIDYITNYFDVYFEICIYDNKNKEGKSQCKIVKDSTTVFFNDSIINNISQIYYISFDYYPSFREYCSFDYFGMKNYTFFEFSLFFINHKIPFDINTNNYIFKFNQSYITNNYSQDYFLFSIPKYEYDKILKIKIEYLNNKENDLFTITNLNTHEETSYSKNKIFLNKLSVSKNEYLIKINYISNINLLYISLDEEVIDLTNIKSEQYVIFNSQRFYIKLLISKIGFVITPFEIAKNATITFYNNKLEKYKERDLESKKTSFYIEKINNNSEYYIDINVTNYIAYKFELMENFEIINETRNITIPPMSTKYFIFTYNIKKEKNNDYFYGLDLESNKKDIFSYDNDFIMEFIDESDNNFDLPMPWNKFILTKSHFIIKTISGIKNELQTKIIYYFNETNKMKTYNAYFNNSEVLKLINNGGIFSNKDITEYILIYHLNGYKYINFQGVGKFLYKTRVNFDIVNNGLDLKYFKPINDSFFRLSSSPILIYIDIKAGDYFQTNLYPDPKLNSEKEYNSYFISNVITKTFNYNCIITFNDQGNDKQKIINFTNGKKNDTYDVDEFIYKRYYYSKNENLTITASGPLIIYFTKEQKDESIQFISFDDQNYYNYKFFKIILPNIKENYTFYKGYGFSKEIGFYDSEYYMNQMREYNIPLNSDKEIRLYFDAIPKKGIPYKSIIYGFNKTYYPHSIIPYKTSPHESHFYNYVRSLPYYSNCINNNIIYKCRNTKVDMYIGNDSFYKEFIWENNDSFYYLNLSKYTSYNSSCILEIYAKSEILIFEGINSKKNNYNISTYNKEFNSTNITLINEEPTNYTMKRYIFSPKNEFYMQNFLDECFLYELIVGSRKYNYITITNSSNCTTALIKGCKEYLVTIVYKSRNNFYYFYKPTIFKVSQKVLDDAFREKDNPINEDKNKSKNNNKSNDISKVIIFIIILFASIALFISIMVIITRNKSSDYNENIEGIKELKLI